MKIFISGASGLVGGNCLQYFKEQNQTVVGTHLSFPTSETVYFNTLDLEHEDNFDVLNFNPDVIVHCGALTHVDYCEDHEAESFEKTVKSTQSLLELAQRCNAKFVFISTDYVFDGKDGPYQENDLTNPLSVYGEHKLIAESFINSNWPNSLILRVTNVYGNEIRGKNFISRIITQCKEGKEVMLKLPYDQFASPTNALDIAKAMFLLLRDKKTGTYHIGGSDFMNRVTLALKVISYFPDTAYQLNTFSTAELNQSAARPLLGGFIPLKFLKEYPDFLFSSVDNFLQKSID